MYAQAQISLHENGSNHDVEEEGVHHAVENQIPVRNIGVFHLPRDVLAVPTKNTTHVSTVPNSLSLSLTYSLSLSLSVSPSLYHSLSVAPSRIQRLGIDLQRLIFFV